MYNKGLKIINKKGKEKNDKIALAHLELSVKCGFLILWITKSVPPYTYHFLDCV